MEDDAANDFVDQFMAVEAPPFPFAFAAQFVDQGEGGGTRAAPFGLVGTVPDHGKTRFDRVGRAQMDPVGRGEVIKAQQLRVIFLQARRRFGILVGVGFAEVGEGLLGRGAGRCQVDLLKEVLGVWLQFLGQLVEHVGRLMHPATLRATGGPLFFQGWPETERAIADGQFRRLLESTPA